MSTQPKTFITPEQYLEIERKAEFKSEYYQGEMFPMGGSGVFAMAGAKEVHNVLVLNVAAGLHLQFRSRPCRVDSNDMRVRVSPSGLYTYPDVIGICGDRKFLDDQKDTLLNPSLIVEVLSPSTEAYDRGRKFERYQSIESLREYVLVAPDRLHVDLYTRQAEGWLLESANRPDQWLDLASVGCRLSLAQVYENVDLSAPAAIP